MYQSVEAFCEIPLLLFGNHPSPITVSGRDGMLIGTNFLSMLAAGFVGVVNQIAATA